MAALEGNNYEPCTMFKTSCRKDSDCHQNGIAESDKKESSINLQDTGFFEKVASHVPILGGKLMSQQCEQYFFKIYLWIQKKQKKLNMEPEDRVNVGAGLFTGAFA